MQKEITRESLHSSLKVKPKEVQDRFLEVANACTRKVTNTAASVNTSNNVVNKFDL